MKEITPQPDQSSPPSTITTPVSANVPASGSKDALTADMLQTVHDAQRLLKYVAKEGNSELNPDITHQLVQARYKAISGQWDAQTETRFMINYDALVSHIYPVSLESINAIKPPPLSHRPSGKTHAEKTVRWYRHLTIAALIILLITQFYWLLGHNLLQNLNELSEQQNAISQKLDSLTPNNIVHPYHSAFSSETSSQKQPQADRSQSSSVPQSSSAPQPSSVPQPPPETDPHQVRQLNREYTLLNQQLDSNLQLLIFWNSIWLTGYQFEPRLPPYLNKKYEIRLEELKKNASANSARSGSNSSINSTDSPSDIADKSPLNNSSRNTSTSNANTNNANTNNIVGQSITTLELEKARHQSRTLLFSNTLAASFAIEILQSFLLPLLYGLLGAFIFVLRTLLLEIRSLTYTPDSDIRYRLRLTLGSLGGMIVGWFLKPDEMNALTALSPMALAFLMGYNVDVLFSIMDRFIDSIKQWIEKPSEQSKKTEKPSHKSVSPNPS